jgi:hypothetical protein
LEVGKLPGKWIIALVVGAIALATAIDIGSRALMGTAPTFVWDRNTERSQTVVVYFTGTQNVGEVHSRQLRAIWKEHGDVLVVEYPKYRYVAPIIVQATFLAAKKAGYTTVIVIGVSGGALLASDFLTVNSQAEQPLEVDRAILVDPPMDGSDLLPASKVAARYPMGAMFNIWTSVFWRIFSGSPKGKEHGADQRLIAEEKATSKWPLSGYRDQVRDITRRDPLTAGAHSKVKLVVLRSDGDEVVSPGSTQKWETVFGISQIFSVRSEHAAFLQYPSAWRYGFEQAFAA